MDVNNNCIQINQTKVYLICKYSVSCSSLRHVYWRIQKLQLAVSIKYVALENRVYEICSKFLQMATNEPSADKA